MPSEIRLLGKSGVWLCCILLLSPGTPLPQNISLNTFALLKTACSSFTSCSVVHKDAKLTFFKGMMKVEQIQTASCRELNAGMNFTSCKRRGSSGILRGWSHILLKTRQWLSDFNNWTASVLLALFLIKSSWKVWMPFHEKFSWY